MTEPGLATSDGPLVPGHDLVLLDLDGVVYLGDRPVPGAATALAEARAAGAAVEFVTNNASRRATAVAELLRRHGVAAAPAEVTTSAQGTAALLAERLPAGSVVLVVGAPALAAELAEVGLTPTYSAEDGPVAVVQGYGRDVGWVQLAEAMVAVRAGACWVATNLDTTVPSPRGPLPGNGSMVAALAGALGRRPDVVVGKPDPALFQQAARRRGAARPLVVGDRLDTDIEGAVRAGLPSLLVLTGVTTPAELLPAPAQHRPSYLAADLGGLLAPHPAPEPVSAPDGAWAARCGGFTATRHDETVTLAGGGDVLDALRAICAAAWQGNPPARPVAESDQAAKALAELGL